MAQIKQSYETRIEEMSQSHRTDMEELKQSQELKIQSLQDQLDHISSFLQRFAPPAWRQGLCFVIASLSQDHYRLAFMDDFSQEFFQYLLECLMTILARARSRAELKKTPVCGQDSLEQGAELG
ncbi:uncharacterized protein LOC120110615 isoform X1 [Phoenix dactylifera]|uniref:Uncharacterized protein LOC120110615 isoform X1 n=1 Tax=Phoenix dactylifera TaxID=42345 RepID=A0A8B9A8M3_PHODC|nr:uncharacterized protein LOC120110615 isoform X1 [Phoenix dactylifera]